LKAKTILFQCPASFKQTKENISNLKRFFTRVKRKHDRGEFNFCWEPRGDWEPAIVKRICDELNLWHAVDPFQSRTVTPDKIYYRLHGKKGWRYEYDDSELHELAAMLPISSTIDAAYVFFNNVRMIQDAKTFKAIVKPGQNRLR
jgi:uncharacterized protein YecE (DUF72 family)